MEMLEGWTQKNAGVAGFHEENDVMKNGTFTKKRTGFDDMFNPPKKYDVMGLPTKNGS